MPRSLATALLLVALLAAAPALALEAADSKVYRGSDGQLVEVVTLEPRTSAEVLIRVRGTRSEHDGLALRCAVKQDAHGTDYVTRYQGSDYGVLIEREGSYEAFLPGTRSFRVKFDQAATDKVSGEDVLAAHQQQLESGRLVAFQKKPWPFLEKKYTARATQAVAALAQRCGTAPAFTFDWKSFGDEEMAELDVWAACAPLVTATQNRCASVKGLSTLVCRFGPALGLERGGDTLTFTTTRKGAAEGPSFLNRKLSP